MRASEGVRGPAEEKKRKAKAPEAAKAMQVMKRREMKTMVVVGFWGDPAGESVLNESRAVDWFGASSSWAGIGVGFAAFKMDSESEPIRPADGISLGPQKFPDINNLASGSSFAFVDEERVEWNSRV